MDVEDFAEPEVGIAVAITAAVCSPRVRKGLRKGLIYGLAGLISVGDAAKDAADGMKKAVNGRKAAPTEVAAVEPEPVS